MSKSAKPIEIVLINDNGNLPPENAELSVVTLDVAPYEQRNDKGLLLLFSQPSVLIVKSQRIDPVLFVCYHLQGRDSELLMSAERRSYCSHAKVIIDVDHWTGFVGFAPDDETLMHLLDVIAHNIKNDILRTLYDIPNAIVLSQKPPIEGQGYSEYFTQTIQWSMNMGYAGFPIPAFNN